MLKSIFYARFHPERGPDVLHQHPPGTVSRASPLSSSSTAASSASAASLSQLALSPNDNDNASSLVSFPPLASYLIPPHELSNRALSVCASGHRVLGHPISIEGEGYERNRFVCNVCFVVEDVRGAGEEWEGVVGKMAGFMRALEEEGGVLWREEREVDGAGGEGVVGELLREVFGQLGRWGECCVRVSGARVLNLRVGRGVGGERGRERVRVRGWDVPLVIRALPDSERVAWDLVLERVWPFVDGVNDVGRIARLADVDVKLVKRAVRELVLHERAMVLDIFHFQAVYMSSFDISLFMSSEELVDECREYVTIDSREGMFASVLGKDVLDEARGAPSRATIVELYSTLKPGLSVADFCLSHMDRLANIDVRRFITFGVIKGFLRRMHKYVLALDPPETPAVPRLSTATDLDKAWRKAALSSGWATPPTEGLAGLQEKLDKEEEVRAEAARLVKYLDGKHCMDQVCVEMGMNEKKVLEKVKSGMFGEIVIFCR